MFKPTPPLCNLLHLRIFLIFLRCPCRLLLCNSMRRRLEDNFLMCLELPHLCTLLRMLQCNRLRKVKCKCHIILCKCPFRDPKLLNNPNNKSIKCQYNKILLQCPLNNRNSHNNHDHKSLNRPINNLCLCNRSINKPCKLHFNRHYEMQLGHMHQCHVNN